jgi:hypothetical protein
MTNASSSNVQHSDTALLTGPQKKQYYNTDDERVFLTQQAADAKTAMQHTVADMQVTAKEVANISWWTQQYPWYAVGAAAVLGFVAATSVLAPADHQPAPPAASQTAARSSWMAPLFGMIRSILMGIIADALHARGQQAGQDQPAQADASLS